MEQKITSLLNWLHTSPEFYLNENVTINETEASGRGVVLCKNKLVKNDLIISVPTTHQINFHTVLYHISKFNPDLSIPSVTVNEGSIDIDDPRNEAYSILEQDFLLELTSFQLLCLYIIAEWILLPVWSNDATVSYWKPFFDVLPAKEELRSIPTKWNLMDASPYKPLIPFLSDASFSHTERISKLVKNDWEIIAPILLTWNNMFSHKVKDVPSMEELYLEYLHVYFVINSRCLYYEIPIKKNKDIASNFTLVPYVDFLNHVPEVGEHCYPSLTTTKHETELKAFTIRCGEKGYNQVGEEIFLNYGAHSNDFLSNEYGFVLENNEWNFIDVSEEILEMTEGNLETISFLKENEYWGDYTINFDDISYRIWVTMSLIVTKDIRRVEKFIQGFISEDFFRPKIREPLIHLLSSLKKKYEERIINLTQMRLHDINDTWCIDNLLIIYNDYLYILDHHISALGEINEK
ncbi:hypothetical protein NCAS_0B02990 [Naumovozyma castellii]|uniref:SET domain-containing protein n=1 Tax=Naumovozyma castellii TaxID=27288 RepID=G0VBQ7_NAUCA|nr:hypothetical protein NCAS_0B02990 [Naumovozyma castellii CBS 4309]CCC68383.1 hypothetical protein NCAS_0B02990 [Naumovozyma castellii CBS 4309]